MNPKYVRLYFEVVALRAQAERRAAHLFFVKPSSWVWERQVLKRAINSAFVALNAPDNPNYTRLVLARDELKAVV